MAVLRDIRYKLLGWFKIASLRKTRSLWSKVSKDRVGKRSETDGVPVRADRKTTERFTRFEELGQELLPGIPDDITLSGITAKLSWRDMQIMSSVSLGWRQATRSNKVYDARVRIQSTETLAVWIITESKPWDSQFECEKKILLRSMRDKFSLQLPPIRGLRRDWPFCAADCVSLNGKIYIFGGAMLIRNCQVFTQVHVMDLAAHSISWTLVESHSFPDLEQAHRMEFTPCKTASTRDDEHLFVHANWGYTSDPKLSRPKIRCLYQSRGSCNDDKEIVWENAQDSCSSTDCFYPSPALRASTCKIQL